MVRSKRVAFSSSRAAPAALGAILLMLVFSASQAHAAGMLIADGGLGGQLEIKEHSVNVTINNGIAVTQVTEVFQNMESRQVEGLYTFPVPNNASVANFSMWIGGKEMVGEVLEKNKARQIYNSYKQARRDPGLLEQVDYKTFEMRVFPIAPRAEQKVQVTYYQELDVDHDWATFVYPLATTTRGPINSVATSKFALTLNVKSEVPIVDIESTSHPKDFAFAKHNPNYFQASLETKQGDLNRDVVLAYHLARPHTGIDLIASRQGDQDGYFCMTLTAGEELKQRELGMDYVFILDISGSMNDDGKLDLSRNSLDAFVKNLGKDDRFEVMTFNVTAHPLFNQIMAANDENKATAASFLASQEAKGGTVLNPALNTAYKYADAKRTLNVVILSDGLTDDGDAQTLLRLIKARPANSRVFSIGVGNDVNKPLLQDIADKSGGLSAFLSRGDNFARAAEAFRRKLLRPVASDLQLGFAGVQVYDVEPQQMPNLYYGAPVRVYGRYKDGAPAKITLAGKVGDDPLTTVVALDFPKQDAANPEVERMWAWHQVQRLLKEADAVGSRPSVLDQVVKLGEGYSIATEYTSFIVLENDEEFQRWHIERRNALRLDRDRQSQAATNAKLEAMRNEATDALGPAAVQPKPVAAAPDPQTNVPVNASPDVQTNAPVNASPDASAPAWGNPSPIPQPNGQSADVPTSNGGGTNGRGAGAIDPFTATMALALAGLAWAAFRNRRCAA
jgi:Ca-activated chloride channel family protein